MEKITTVERRLAKNVFSLHGVDANGKVALKRTVRRASWYRRWRHCRRA